MYLELEMKWVRRILPIWDEWEFRKTMWAEVDSSAPLGLPRVLGRLLNGLLRALEHLERLVEIRRRLVHG